VWLLWPFMTEFSPGELALQFELLAVQLKELTGSLAGTSESGGSPVLRLAVLTADVSGLVAYLLHNADQGALDGARYNLQVLHSLSEEMVTAVRAALADCDARIPARHGHCLARVQLDSAEREWLEFRPAAANEVPASLSCDLESGHPGSHGANAQMGDGVEWWIHWTLRASEIVERKGCWAETPDPKPYAPDEVDVCLLYAGHPGRHSFALGR